MQTSVSVPAIAIESVTKRFGHITAVDDVSLEIRPGEVLALLGPNGAGKTTLPDMGLGFAEPNTGSIHAFGETPKPATSNGHIDAVLQDGALLDALTLGVTIKMSAPCACSQPPDA